MKEILKTEFDKIVQNSKFSKKEIEFRKENLNKFIKEGFPTKKNENWKFSDISQIIQNNIGDLKYYNDYSLSKKTDNLKYVSEFDHNKIIFVNGKLEKIDFKNEEKNKIEILDTNEKDQELRNINSLVALNNVFTDKNHRIIIKKNYSLKKPLIIYNTTNNKISSKNLNISLNFILEENSCLKLINLSDDDSRSNFINNYYTFHLKKNSILKNYKIDLKTNKNIKYFFNNIDQEENSISETFFLSSGSTFSKNEVNCNLKGKFASAFVNGIFSLNNKKHHEIKSNINHLFENTKSYQLIKAVLGDESKAVYQGKIFVNSDAQKTDGYQLSKAILLNENSEFNAKPELEIYADDVKCSHGSASGNLNEDSIFYIMSRGLNYEESKKLLINGFLLDVVEKITDDEIKKFMKNILNLE